MNVKIVEVNNMYLDLYKKLRLEELNKMRKEYGLTTNINELPKDLNHFNNNYRILIALLENNPRGYIVINKESNSLYSSYIIDNDKMILSELEKSIYR